MVAHACGPSYSAVKGRRAVMLTWEKSKTLSQKTKTLKVKGLEHRCSARALAQQVWGPEFKLQCPTQEEEEESMS
jgi:hypothetical protein